MSVITTIESTDIVKDSRAVINTNFSNLNTDIVATETVVNPASASAPASLDLAEDTDNGVNKITITAPSAVASDKVLTLPDADGTVATTANIPVKASGAEITTGTDDAKFLTPKALADATVGKLGAAWATYVPIWSGLVIGNATVSARYFQIGKTVRGRIDVVFGSTSSFSTTFGVSLPVTSVSIPGTAQTQPIGNICIFDQSAGITYGGNIRWATTTTATLVIIDVASATTYSVLTSVTNVKPMTWTTSDELHIDFIYEAA